MMDSQTGYDRIGMKKDGLGRDEWIDAMELCSIWIDWVECSIERDMMEPLSTTESTCTNDTVCPQVW
jgi:hypothetical protein